MINDKEVFKHMKNMIKHSSCLRVLIFKRNERDISLIQDIYEVDRQSFNKNGELCTGSKRYISAGCLTADEYSIEQFERE